MYKGFGLTDSDLWTETIDVHGPGGVPHSFTTLEECQRACIKDIKCVAIDWEPNNAGYECWILQLSYTGPTTQPGHVIHYGLNRPLLGESCSDAHAFLGLS